MRKIFFAFSLVFLFVACTRNNQEMNLKLEKEHQNFVVEHETWQKENETRKAAYEKWSKEYESLSIKKDTANPYNVHEELKKEHTAHIEHGQKLLEYNERFLKAHTILLLAHKNNEIVDKDFQEKHDLLAKNHAEMLALHEQMKKRHEMFEQEQVLEMETAKKKQAEEESKVVKKK